MTGMPFGALGLHFSFMMIFVPFFLALIFAYRDQGKAGVAGIFQSVLDLKKVHVLPLLFAVFCMPAVTGLSFLVLKLAGLLPANLTFSYGSLPVSAPLFFLGAIPEEVAWTYTLTGPLSRRFSPLAAGTLIGCVWGLWHVIPWSWNHAVLWVIGMWLLNILMRTGMVLNYVHGGGSLFLALIFHAMINMCSGFFGLAFDPWLACIVMIGIDIAVIGLAPRTHPVAVGALNS